MINIITPLWRVQNLPRLYENIVESIGQVKWRWVVVLDVAKPIELPLGDYPRTVFATFVGGDKWKAGIGRNLGLDIVGVNGWVVHHDDDCLFTKALGDVCVRAREWTEPVVRWCRWKDEHVGIYALTSRWRRRQDPACPSMTADTNGFMYQPAKCQRVRWNTTENSDCDLFFELTKFSRLREIDDVVVNWNVLR